jgi:hypothetical protein
MEEVGADLVQVAPAEGGAGQPHGDGLTKLNVDAMATIAAADADDVTPGVAPRHGGPGTTRLASHAEQCGEGDGREQRQSPADSFGATAQGASSARRRSSPLTTLPVALRGRTSTKRYRRGTL